MSCGCGTSPDPGFCGPPSIVPTLVAGPQGPSGKSAYQEWLDLGNEGTEAEFIASLKGAKGDPGTNGADGATGAKGDTGATGATGPGGLMRPVVHFGGAYFKPSTVDGISAAIVACPDSRILRLGVMPAPTGRYFADLKIQIGFDLSFNGNLNSTAWLIHRESYSSWVESMEFFWGRPISGRPTGFNTGTLFEFGRNQVIDATNGWSFEVRSGAGFKLLGGSLTLYAAPENFVQAPGFVDGLYQQIVPAPVVITP